MVSFFPEWTCLSWWSELPVLDIIVLCSTNSETLKNSLLLPQKYQRSHKFRILSLSPLVRGYPLFFSTSVHTSIYNSLHSHLQAGAPSVVGLEIW